jgi:hypothetical protein
VSSCDTEAARGARHAAPAARGSRSRRRCGLVDRARPDPGTGRYIRCGRSRNARRVFLLVEDCDIGREGRAPVRALAGLPALIRRRDRFARLPPGDVAIEEPVGESRRGVAGQHLAGGARQPRDPQLIARVLGRTARRSGGTWGRTATWSRRGGRTSQGTMAPTARLVCAASRHSDSWTLQPLAFLLAGTAELPPAAMLGRDANPARRRMPPGRSSGHSALGACRRGLAVRWSLDFSSSTLA